MSRRIERISMLDLSRVGILRCERSEEFNPGPARTRYIESGDEATLGVEQLFSGTLVLDPTHPLTIALAELRADLIETRRENGVCPWCGLELPMKACYDEDGLRLPPDVSDCLPCDECTPPCPEDE